jgi:hypothetical protein
MELKGRRGEEWSGQSMGGGKEKRRKLCERGTARFIFLTLAQKFSGGAKSI